MEQVNLPRRRFLKIGLAAVAGLAAVGGGAVWLMSGGDEDLSPKETGFGKLLVLDPKRADIFHAFAEAALPKEEGFPTAREAQVVERLDEELYFVDASIRGDVKMVIDVFNLLPFFYGRFSTFTSLEPEDRTAFLKETQATKSDTVRVVVNALRMGALMMYYGHESTWNVIGYDGPHGGLEPIMNAQRTHYAQRTGRA